MKRLMFIYNPKAGRQRVRGMLPDLLEVFAREGYETTVHPTMTQGEATKLAAQLAPGYDRLVCCGGDGTLNETVCGLLSLPEDRRPVLGYIPTGTTNDFARTLGLPKSTEKLAEVACGGVPRAVDIGDSQGRFFTYISAFGLFTDVSYSTPQSAKNLLGHFAYVLESAGRLLNIPSYHMEVTVDGERTVCDDFIYGMVSNTLSVGGVMSLPRDEVKLDDGRFEVLLVRPPRTPKDWQSILAALNAQTAEREDGAVIGLTASRVTFRCDRPVAWTVDGEFGGERQETTVKNLPRALSIACGL